MPIPTQADRDLGEIDDLAAGINTRLSVMRFAGKGARDYAGLRDQLQEFVDKVMQLAKGTQP